MSAFLKQPHVRIYIPLPSSTFRLRSFELLCFDTSSSSLNNGDLLPAIRQIPFALLKYSTIYRDPLTHYVTYSTINDDSRRAGYSSLQRCCVFRTSIQRLLNITVTPGNKIHLYVFVAQSGGSYVNLVCRLTFDIFFQKIEIYCRAHTYRFLSRT